MATFALDGSFAVDASGRELHLRCWGSGDTTVVIEGGDGEIVDFERSEVVSRVAAHARVCLYDRAGRGSSDPAPNVPRGPEAVAGDLHALLEAAGVDGRLILAGSSLGGDLVLSYASVYPEEVDGVITLDTPAPDLNTTPEEFPEGAWDHPQNREHLDFFDGFLPRLRKGLRFDAPLIVVTASHGQSSVEDQSFWLTSSPNATQVELEGDHEIYRAQPERVAELILSLAQGLPSEPS